jgi:hypothetical protein
MLKKSLIAVVCTIVASAALHAVTMSHPAGFQVTYPDDWTKMIEGNDLKILSPDGKAVMLFRVIEVNSIPEAVQGLETEVKKIITRPKFEHGPKPVTINELPGLLSDGSGVIKGIKAKWLVGLFIREKNGLMVLGFANAEAFPAHEETLKGIINSISKK